MAAQQERGPVGNTRSIGLSILWAILTIGIYTFIWTYKTQEEVKRYSGNGVGGVIGLVIYFVLSPVTFFIVPSEVRYMYEDLDGERSPVRGITGLWFILPLIGHIVWFVKVQGAVNQLSVRRRRKPERPTRCEPPHRLRGALEQRQALGVALTQPLHDLTADLSRRVGNAQDVVHVARPLGRAHAHHVGLCALAP